MVQLLHVWQWLMQNMRYYSRACEIAYVFALLAQPYSRASIVEISRLKSAARYSQGWR